MRIAMHPALLNHPTPQLHSHNPNCTPTTPTSQHSPMNRTATTKFFQIWQQNIAKSSMAQHNLLAKAHPSKWDIIVLQEPYLDHLGLTWANSHWTVLYPSNKNLKNQNHTWSILLINTKIDSSQIQQININSSDITAVKITTNTHSIIIINIYNDIHHNQTINTLAEVWATNENNWILNHNATELLLLGDFN